MEKSVMAIVHGKRARIEERLRPFFLCKTSSTLKQQKERTS